MKGQGTVRHSCCLLRHQRVLHRCRYCQTYLTTLGPAVRSCGPNIRGLEFDHEGDDEHGPFGLDPKYWGRAGIVSKDEARWFTQLMDDMQRSMGGNYTVGEDIGVW